MGCDGLLAVCPAGHPRLFVTLTAPSFGPVHSRRKSAGRARRCHPAAGSCSHGRPGGCRAVHDERDPRLGSPLCPDCFDYPTAVLWNAVVPELWRRTTIYLTRALAGRAGLSRAELDRRVRIAFTKVAEYQDRGVVHLHAVLRLDARPRADQPELVAPPPSGFDAELLAAAVRDAVHAVRVPLPPVTPSGTPGRARWGRQLDIREIGPATETSDKTSCSNSDPGRVRLTGTDVRMAALDRLKKLAP